MTSHYGDSCVQPFGYFTEPMPGPFNGTLGKSVINLLKIKEKTQIKFRTFPLIAPKRRKTQEK
jgi:hypothetical protein